MHVYIYIYIGSGVGNGSSGERMLKKDRERDGGVRESK